VSGETIDPSAGIGPEDAVRVACSATEHVSLAYYENAIPVIREIVITNASEEDLTDLQLQIESRPAVVQPLTLRIDRIPAGSNHHIETVDVRLDAALLATVGPSVGTATAACRRGVAEPDGHTGVRCDAV
jgi:hypothetical protein